MLKGAELAAAELNEEEGILAREVEVVPIDDAADPATGVRAAEEAIEEGLDGVIGPYNSGVGVKTLPLYIDAGLVPIRLTSDVSTDGLGYTLQPMSFQIAPVASRALTDWLGAKSVAIAYDPTQNYTRSVSSELKTGLEEAGVEVTAYSKVKPGKSSYTAELEELDAAEPDVIYAAVYYPEGGLIAKEMNAGDFAAKCVADYASYDTGYVETAGIAAARSCPVVGVPAPEDFAGAAEKVDAFRESSTKRPAPGAPTPTTPCTSSATGSTKRAKRRRRADGRPRLGRRLEGLDRHGDDRTRPRLPPARHRGDRRNRRRGGPARRRELGEGGRRSVLEASVSRRGGARTRTRAGALPPLPARSCRAASSPAAVDAQRGDLVVEVGALGRRQRRPGSEAPAARASASAAAVKGA